MDEQQEINRLAKELSKANLECLEANTKISALYRNSILLLLFIVVLIANHLRSAKDYKSQIEALEQEKLSLATYYEESYSKDVYWSGYSDGYDNGYSEGEEHMIEYFDSYIGSNEFYNDYGIEKPQ